MIRFSLKCQADHAFESWFQSSAAYESQEKRKLVSCPNCGSVKVERAIMLSAEKRMRDELASHSLKELAEQVAAKAPAKPAAKAPAKKAAKKAGKK